MGTTTDHAMAQPNQKHAATMKLPWPGRFLGYGPTPEHTMSALWEPITNRFILVSYRADILVTLSKFTSRKFKSVVVNLDSSVSTLNLVDNDVCLNWTLAESKQIPLSEHSWHPVDGGEILEVGPYNEWDLQAEQDFFMAAHWILESLITDTSFSGEVTGGIPSDWLQSYMIVNTVIDDPVLLSANIEMQKVVNRGAMQAIFNSHTHQELDQAWYQVLEQCHLVDAWTTWVGSWNKK